VFSHWSSLMGTGIVGGYLVSGERIGRLAGHVALARADGKDAAAIIEREAATAYGSYYDWRQLQRFGLSEARLPEGAEVLWRQPSFFDEYRWQIILVLSLTAVLALSVAVLLWLDLQRRRALRALAEERLSLERRVEERTADLRRTAGALERTNQELQQFAYAVSHDLQEPLRTVTGYLQLLERMLGNSLEGDSKDFLNFAVDGGRRMHAMIKDLLEYSRLGVEDAPVSPVDAEGALAEALSNLRGMLKERHGRVTSDGLPLVHAAGPQLVRLLQNLIGNSIKYASPARPPEIHLSAECDGVMWTISVADNGIGIGPEFRDRVFGLFQRLHARGQFDGNGVGLALCRRIVERHGGRIWVEGRPGGEEGSVFRFTLPLARQTSKLAMAGE
jgi:signal transduction histidine kinase